VATSLSTLGFVAEARGRITEAIDQHRAAYEAVAATGHPRAVPLALEGLAAAALRSGDPRWAGRLLGCSEGLRAASGATRSPSEQADVERILGDVAATALAEGRTLPAGELVSGGQR
jgi:hypothetical protein